MNTSPTDSIARKSISILFSRKAFKAAGLLTALLMTAAYLYLMTPSVFEKILIEQFNAMSNGRLSLKVHQSSLFRGFIFEDIEIQSGPDFNAKPIFQLEKFTCLYSVYGFFAGDFGLHELGLYKPRVYLYQKNGKWNAETLMKPGEPAPEEPETEPAAESSGMQALDLPFSVRFFFKFVLQDFEAFIDGGDDTDPLQAGVKNLTLRTTMLTDKVSYIPFDQSLIRIFKTFIINLDPQKEIDFYVKVPETSVEGPMEFHWLLAADNETAPARFTSRMVIGESSLPVEYEGVHLLPLNFSLNYVMNYDSNRDRLTMNHLTLKFLDDVWFNLEGLIEKPADPTSTTLSLTLDRSNIDLKKLLPYYRSFTGDESLQFSGKVSIAPLYIQGSFDDLKIDGKMNLEKLRLSMPDGKYYIPYFQLYYGAMLNINQENPLVYAKTGWKGALNGAALLTELEYRPERKIYAMAQVSNFNPARFVENVADGNFNMTFKLWGQNETHLNSTFNMNSPRFFYYLDRGRSGVNRFDFDIKTEIKSSPDFSVMNVSVPLAHLSVKNKKMEEAIVFDANTRVNMTPDRMTASFRLNEMSVHFQHLLSTLTEALQEPLQPLAEKTRHFMTLKGDTDVTMVGEEISVLHVTNLLMKDYEIDDVFFKAKVDTDTRNTIIHYVTLDGLNEALEMSLTGDIREKMKTIDDPDRPGHKIRALQPVPNLDFSFYLGRHERGRIFQNQTIEGAVAMAAAVRDSIIDGTFVIDKFYYDDGGFTRVNNVNMLFPFHHDMELQKTVDLGSAGKEQIVADFDKNYNINFTIDSIEIPNPNNHTEPLTIVYPGGQYSGVTAAMLYDENIFRMPIFQVFALNGLITIQDLAFNVGRARLEEMGFHMLTQVKSVDLKLIMPEQRAETIKDGTVSFDIMADLQRMDDPINNINGYFSIYQVGEEFGKQLISIGKPDWNGRLLSTANNTAILRKMDVNIKEGLVDIITIISQKGIGSAIVDIEEDLIETRRMHIQEFMQEATEQVRVYQVRKPPEDEEEF